MVLIKQRRNTFEKLNFCNIKDLQLKLSASKATSPTVQDVHPNIARGDGKEKARQLYYTCLKVCLKASAL